MKKSSFVKGAFITTFGIIICKIIGLIYVIPFYAMIDKQGSALYGYAYSIYSVFLSLSSVGIPIAMSKIIGEYTALGFNDLCKRVYKLGKWLMLGLGLVGFIVLLVFANEVAYFIIGNVKGGNSIADIALVIRVIATALLVVPLLSVTKGYLQGQSFMAEPSMSLVIEQLVRVVFLLVGIYLAINIFHLQTNITISIAVFAATIGAFASYLYLVYKIKKNKKLLNENVEPTLEEKKVSTNQLLKKILIYALPFIIMDVVKNAYTTVDTFTVVKAMVNLGYNVEVAELTIAVITTWAAKLYVIVISIASGITVSLIPNIAGSFAKKDMSDVKNKCNQSLQILLYLALPLTLGLSFLAAPIWTIFYGYNQISIDIFKLFAFQAISYSFFAIILDMTQVLNKTKIALSVLTISFIAKMVFNVPMMNLCYSIGIPAYYGPIIANLIIQTISVLIVIYFQKRKLNISYKDSVPIFLKTIFSGLVMLASLFILSLFINPITSSRGMSLVITLLYALIGGSIYFIVTYKLGIFDVVFGNGLLKRLIRKIKKPSKA